MEDVLIDKSILINVLCGKSNVSFGSQKCQMNSVILQSFKYFCDIDHLFQISGGACGLVLTANAIMFLTILGFFIAFDGDDVQYSVW